MEQRYKSRYRIEYSRLLAFTERCSAKNGKRLQSTGSNHSIILFVFVCVVRAYGVCLRVKERSVPAV